jgi:hypothetical protein
VSLWPSSPLVSLWARSSYETNTDSKEASDSNRVYSKELDPYAVGQRSGFITLPLDVNRANRARNRVS